MNNAVKLLQSDWLSGGQLNHYYCCTQLVVPTEIISRLCFWHQEQNAMHSQLIITYLKSTIETQEKTFEVCSKLTIKTPNDITDV